MSATYRARAAQVQGVYENVMSDVPVDFGSNGFNAWNAWNYARTTLGWTDAELFQPGATPGGPSPISTTWLDDHLDRGVPVLMKLVWQLRAGKPGRQGQHPPGGGHIVLFVGRTARGDYVVYDPAGDYFTGSADNTVNRHYGGQIPAAAWPSTAGATKDFLAQRSDGPSNPIPRPREGARACTRHGHGPS